MLLELAWNNVRTNRIGLLATFVAVTLAVMLVASAGLLLSAAGSDDRLAQVMPLLVMSSLVSAFVSVFTVAGALSLHVLQQRRLWALLRSVGLRPRQVRRLVLAEAMVVGAVASAAGCALALPYGLVVVRVLVGTGLAPRGFALEISGAPLTWAAVVGLGVPLLAAFGASRRAARVAPLEVMREDAAQARPLTWARALIATCALAGGGRLLVITPEVGLGAAFPTGLGAMAALCVAASAMGPALLRLTVWALAAPLPALDPGPGELARAAILTQPRRAMSTASPVMLTIAVACTFVFAVATSDEAAGIERTGIEFWSIPLLVGPAVIYTMISVLNSAAVSTGGRAGELRLLRSVGMTSRQVARALCWESLIVTIAGAALGTGIAAASLTALSLAATDETQVAYSVPQYLTLLGLCLASALAGALLATRRARLGPLPG